MPAGTGGRFVGDVPEVDEPERGGGGGGAAVEPEGMVVFSLL